MTRKRLWRRSARGFVVKEQIKRSTAASGVYVAYSSAVRAVHYTSVQKSAKKSVEKSTVPPESDSIPGWDVQRELFLSNRDRDALISELENPSEPSEALVSGMSGFWEKFGG